MRLDFLNFAPVVIVLLLATTVSANVPERTNIGTLTCTATTTKRITKPVLRKLSCSFEGVGDAAKRVYAGEIIHRGPNVTMRAEEVLIWNVWRTGDSPKPGSLLGKYFGIREDDPSQPGLGANTLIGGKDQALLLEPVVNPGARDADVNVLTVVELELRPARI